MDSVAVDGQYWLMNDPDYTCVTALSLPLSKPGDCLLRVLQCVWGALKTYPFRV